MAAVERKIPARAISRFRHDGSIPALSSPRKLHGIPATGYLDPMTMQAFLLGENGPVATSTYEAWGGGGWWAEVISYSIPSAALSAGLPDRGMRVPLVRVRSGTRVLPVFYSEVDGTIIAYDGGKRTEFRVTDFEVLCYPPLTAPPVCLSGSGQAASVATTKAVLATSFELYDKGRASVTAVYLNPGRSVLVLTRPVKGKTAAGARYIQNARLEFLGAGS